MPKFWNKVEGGRWGVEVWQGRGATATGGVSIYPLNGGKWKAQKWERIDMLQTKHTCKATPCKWKTKIVKISIMARQKNDGKGRIGGREKGTPNKVTTDLRKWVEGVLEGGRDKFVEAMESMGADTYVKTYLTLLNYALPRQAPTSPDSLLEKERIMLQDLVLTLPDEMVERVAQRLKILNDKSNENKSEQF